MLVAYAGLVVYTFKGGSIQIGFLVMALIYSSMALIGNNFLASEAFIAANQGVMPTNIIDVISRVFQTGPENFGANLVNIIFGAWFGQVIVETRIAEGIIRKTVELGGDRPGVTMVLLSVICTFIFSGLYGAGSVIAIGVIVLPILTSLGIPKVVALFSYIASVGASLYINPVQYSQWVTIFDIRDTYSYEQFFNWGIIALIIQIAILAVFCLFYLKKEKTYAWAAQVDMPEEKKADKVPTIAFIAPITPVVLLYVLKVPVIAGFLIAGFFAMAVCEKMKTFKDTAHLFAKNFHDGIVDVAPFLGFLLTVGMFNASAALASPYLGILLSGLQLNNPLFLCVMFAILAPLALFRGPLTIAGAGAATARILMTIGFTRPFVLMVIGTTSISMHFSGCFTQSWTAWGIGYTKVQTNDWLKKAVPACWAVAIVVLAYTYIVYKGVAL